MAAVIGKPYGRTESKVALYSEVPLVHLGVLKVKIACLLEELSSRLRQLRGEWIGECECRVSIHNGLVIESLVSAVNGVRRTEQSAQRSLNEPSVAAANYCLSVGKRPPGKANARTEVGLLRKTQARRDSQLRGRQNRRARNGSCEIRVQNLERLLVGDDHSAIYS